MSDVGVLSTSSMLADWIEDVSVERSESRIQICVCRLIDLGDLNIACP